MVWLILWRTARIQLFWSSLQRLNTPEKWRNITPECHRQKTTHLRVKNASAIRDVKIFPHFRTSSTSTVYCLLPQNNYVTIGVTRKHNVRKVHITSNKISNFFRCWQVSILLLLFRRKIHRPITNDKSWTLNDYDNLMRYGQLIIRC